MQICPIPKPDVFSGRGKSGVIHFLGDFTKFVTKFASCENDIILMVSTWFSQESIDSRENQWILARMECARAILLKSLWILLLVTNSGSLSLHRFGPLTGPTRQGTRKTATQDILSLRIRHKDLVILQFTLNNLIWQENNKLCGALPPARSQAVCLPNGRPANKHNTPIKGEIGVRKKKLSYASQPGSSR